MPSFEQHCAEAQEKFGKPSSVPEKYSGWSCGGAGWLASLLLSYRFLSNMLLRRASPSNPPRSQPHCRPFFQTRSYAEVHLWLDEFAGQPPYGMRHRRRRHHLAGIELVRQRWGDEAAEAARQHILSDLKMVGWRDTDPFPQSEQHYAELSLF